MANRCNRKPEAIIEEHRISSDEIKKFIAAKAVHYKSGIKIELVTDLWERKRGGHKRYTLMKLALSDAALARTGYEDDWLRSIAMENNNIRFVDQVWMAIVKKYSYNRKSLENILGNYKLMDELEEMHGINEEQLKALIKLAQPRMFKAGKDQWIMLAIRPEAVIADMLTEQGADGKLPGTIEIVDIVPISKNTVEYVTHLYLGDHRRTQVNPELLKMLENS